MNVAYQAVVLFAYVLPGILFRKRLSAAGRFRHSRSLTDELAQSLVYAAIGHGIWIAICSLCPAIPNVDLRAALMHAMGEYGPDSRDFESAVSAVTDHFGAVIMYFLSLNIFAFMLGSLLRKCHEQKWRWHRAFIWLQEDEPADDRFRRWSSLLLNSDSEKESVRLLTTVVELGKIAYLFAGKLEDVHFGPDGNPDHFVLSGVMRRPLHPNEVERIGQRLEELNEDGFHEVFGESFVIRAAEARTLNVVVRHLELASEGDSLPSDDPPLQ